jgi:hypothetical protein
MTPYPGHEWMEQQARNATMEEWGFLRDCRYLLHDHDRKFCGSFRELIESGSVKTIRLPARSPNLNSFAERCVRSVNFVSPLETEGARNREGSGVVSGATGWSAEVLRARGRIGVEVGTASHAHATGGIPSMTTAEDIQGFIEISPCLKANKTTSLLLWRLNASLMCLLWNSTVFSLRSR